MKTLNDEKMRDKVQRPNWDVDHFCVFPALGYWEMDGKPVSSKMAKDGSNPKAIWRPADIAKMIQQEVGLYRGSFGVTK